jgi:hypothetical protein
MFRACLLAILVFATVSAAHAQAPAQVRVTLPWSDYRPLEIIRARIHNDSTEPITYCVEKSQRSPAGAFVESTPTPFVFEQSIYKRDWDVVMVVPETARAPVPVVLEAGKAADFLFRVGSGGWYRLLLHYWRGAKPNLACEKDPREKKSIRSEAFLVWGMEY